MKVLDQKSEIKKDIKFLKSSGREELYRVFMDALFAYFKCLTTFGFNNPYTKECFNVVKEIKKVIKEEKRLLAMLDNNIDHINLDDLEFMVSEIDEIGENAYLDYSDILDNIYASCDSKDKNRIVRGNKPINSIVTNPKYKEKVYSLIQKGTMSK